MSYRRTTAPDADLSSLESSPQPYSLVDRHSTVDGTLSTSESLRIEGSVTGAIHCEGTLYIAERAEIDATIDASDIVVAGSVAGTITCRGRLEIRSTGVVRAGVETSRLVIHEGGTYEGRLTMTHVEAPVEVEEEPDVEVESAPAASATVPPTNEPSYSFLRTFAPPHGGPRPVQDDLPAASDEDDEDE